MKAVDGQLAGGEAEEFRALLRAHPELATEWRAFDEMKNLTAGMRLPEPPAEMWENYWANIYNRLERGMAWVLLSIGMIVLLSFALYAAVLEIIEAAALNLVVKAGILLSVAGFVTLTLSVVREKLAAAKQDPYKRVER